MGVQGRRWEREDQNPAPDTGIGSPVRFAGWSVRLFLTGLLPGNCSEQPLFPYKDAFCNGPDGLPLVGTFAWDSTGRLQKVTDDCNQEWYREDPDVADIPPSFALYSVSDILCLDPGSASSSPSSSPSSASVEKCPNNEECRAVPVGLVFDIEGSLIEAGDQCERIVFQREDQWGENIDDPRQGLVTLPYPVYGPDVCRESSLPSVPSESEISLSSVSEKDFEPCEPRPCIPDESPPEDLVTIQPYILTFNKAGRLMFADLGEPLVCACVGCMQDMPNVLCFTVSFFGALVSQGPTVVCCSFTVELTLDPDVGCEGEYFGSISVRDWGSWKVRFFCAGNRPGAPQAGGWFLELQEKKENGRFIGMTTSDPEATNRCLKPNFFSAAWFHPDTTNEGSNAVCPIGSLSADHGICYEVFEDASESCGSGTESSFACSFSSVSDSSEAEVSASLEDSQGPGPDSGS